MIRKYQIAFGKKENIWNCEIKIKNIKIQFENLKCKKRAF